MSGPRRAVRFCGTVALLLGLTVAAAMPPGKVLPVPSHPVPSDGTAHAVALGDAGGAVSLRIEWKLAPPWSWLVSTFFACTEE
ncbi:hypothetical protein ASG87_16710 [Frateuria sp. Soil773]|uniref:hypothetical protein n=1 Tax=Frateuria sp. Soil773 TaxID=1736407 RepID=UPI0006F7ECB0|nr:hypothetical protein [Frateuria sp. Soil773]KRE96625.1 hypothetical protein ASG87_16710 [Frateuria sp. Soil773]